MCDKLVHLHSIGNCCRITTPETYNSKLWEQRRARLCAVLRSHAANDSKPTSALYASTQLLIDRLIYRTSGNELDPLPNILTDLKNILQDARHHLDYPFWLVSEIIQSAGQFVEDDESFESLVDVIVEWRNEASSASERGRIWLERGMCNLDDEKPYQAIDQLARACNLFAKDESSGELGYALVGLAMAYEAVDLLWAARAFYLASAHRRLAYYAKEGRPDPGAFSLRYQLAELEIRLGRPTCALTLFTLMMENLTHSNSVEELRKQLEDKIPRIDVNLGVLCLRTREVDLPYLEHLPGVFRTMQLSALRGCLLFALGHDAQFCTEFEFEDDVDEFFRDLMISSDYFDGPPEWHCGSHFSYSTRIFGCRIAISGANRIEQMLLAESILGFLEAAAATMVLDQTNLAVRSEVKVEIQTSHRKNRFVTSKVVDGVGGNAMIEVKCPKNLPNESETEHFRSLSLVALQALSLVLGNLSKSTLDKLKATITKQCHWTAMTPLMVSNLLSSTEGYFLKSWKAPSKPERFELKDTKATILLQAIAAKTRNSSGLPYPLHREQLPLLIKPAMWQEADLCYAGYGFEAETFEKPLLILLFRNFALGCSIFESCKAVLSDLDNEERLRLTIILSVNPDIPTHYRIAIREEREGKQLGPLIVLPVKSDSVSNRDKFIESVRHGAPYKVLPGTTLGDSAVNIEPKLAIMKSKIRIVQACEIGPGDPDYDAIGPISESKHVKGRISPIAYLTHTPTDCATTTSEDGGRPPL